MLCSVVLCPEPNPRLVLLRFSLLSHTQNFPKRKTERQRERGRSRAVTLFQSTIMFYGALLPLPLSLSVSLCLCDSFMVHLAALIWVPFLTLFSKFNTSRIHMHNVMRDLLYEYEYYRAALGSPLRLNSNRFSVEPTSFSARLTLKRIERRNGNVERILE